jgi:hypothetical protein
MRDMELFQQADFVVAEVTAPSHGVGYEIAKIDTVKPIFLLHKKGIRISAMLIGSIHKMTSIYGNRIFEYKTKEDIKAIIAEIANIQKGNKKYNT